MPWRQRGVEVQIHTFLTLTLGAFDLLAKRFCRVNTSKEAGCAPELEKYLLPAQGLKPGTVQPELRLLSCLRTRYIYCECRIADSTDSSGSVCGVLVGVYEGVPVIRARRVLRFRIEERPPILRVAANVLNKESRTTEKGWSFISLFVLVAKKSIETYLDTKCSYRNLRIWTDNLVRT